MSLSERSVKSVDAKQPADPLYLSGPSEALLPPQPAMKPSGTTKGSENLPEHTASQFYQSPKSLKRGLQELDRALHATALFTKSERVNVEIYGKNDFD